MKHKVIIVDDHKLFRDGLKLLLNNSNSVDVIADFDSGEAFLEQTDLMTEAIILMDIEMPGMNGITVTKTAIDKNPDVKIVALSMFGENEYYFQMIEAGARGFLLKNSSLTDVLKVIDVVAMGENSFSPELLYSIVKNIRQPHSNLITTENLSEREIEILQLVCEGLNNQEIGDRLFISKRTVDKHRANILEKTGCKNTAQLVMFAIKNKIIHI
jgi:DNA-binding NarL/FixJ family response regulator